MLRASLCTATLVVFTSCAAFAQTAEAQLSFEVASVKPAAPMTGNNIRVGMRGGPGTNDPGQISYSNVSLKNVLMAAYGVRVYQIQGPNWLDSERFDIAAKIPQGATKEEFKVMLQNLLAERFKLTLHRETKDLPMYALLVGKNGPKMKESVDDPAPGDGGAQPAGGPSSAAPPPPPGGGGGGGMAGGGSGGASGHVTVGRDGMPQLPRGASRGGLMTTASNGRFRMIGNRQPMAGLVDMLANQLSRPVVDLTELKGNYDFTLDFAPDEGQRMMGPMGAMPPVAHMPEGGGPGPGANASDPQAGPSIFTAVQEQLGLKLEPRKGPVDLLVIDRVEKTPTEN